VIANSILIAARAALGGIFLVAATTKLLDMRGFRTALQGFGVTGAWAAIGAVAIPVAELLAAGLLIPGATTRAGAAVSILLLLAFEAAIALALRRGAAPECHCFGQLHSRPAGGEALGRNALFLAAALLVLIAGPGPDLGSWLQSSRGPVIALTAVSLLAVVTAYACFSFWRENLRLQGRTGRRNARRPLEVGQVAPEFEAKTLSGDPIESADLLDGDRHVVIVFTGSECGPCRELLPELARWRKMVDGRLGIHVVAAGDQAENRTHAAEYQLPMLLDPDGAVAEAFGIGGTPSGVEIDPDGRIGSSPAAGAPAIEGLIRALLKPAQITARDERDFLRSIRDGVQGPDLSRRDRERLVHRIYKPVRDVDRPPPTRWERSRHYGMLHRRLARLLVERHMDTEGMVLEFEHLESERAHYEPSPLPSLRWGLRRLHPGPEDVLVDFGCGKGRVICEAARRPFARVIGVEISQSLLNAARENVERNRRRFRCQNIDLVNADATDWEIPHDMTVAYLFHPFAGAVFDHVIENIVRSIERNPRRVRLVYAGPVFERNIISTGYFRLAGRRQARGRHHKVFSSVALFEHEPGVARSSLGSEVAATSR
jgi:SAM-dependent methyltransferase/thiol-disulfide isomerase/thioredoxin/uncharacterized membrane protein YphA (DoxX/SURF4 family)